MKISFIKNIVGYRKVFFLTTFFLLCVQNMSFAETNKTYKAKKYNDIGITKTASINKINRAYIGFDVYWLIRRFDKGTLGIVQIRKNAIFDGDFFSRFKNFSAHIGWRINEYMAVEAGYLRFGNIINLSSTQETLNGAFADLYFYQQITSNKYTCLESYASMGFFFTHGSISKKYGYGFKVGGGIQLKIYGPLAVKFGVEYYYPGSNIFAKEGFLTLKTGFDLYFAS